MGRRNETIRETPNDNQSLAGYDFEMQRSRSSLRSVGILTVCSFVQLAIQLGIQLVLAKQFGASSEMDAYYAAMSLPTVLAAIFLGSLDAAFVPVYMTCRQNEGDESARRFASQFGLWLLISGLVLSAVGFLAAVPLMSWLHPGFDADQVGKTAELFRILTWLTILNGLTSFLNALHHSEKRFRTPAFAGVIGVAVTLGLVLVEPFRGSTAGVAWAVLWGSIVCVGLQSKLFIEHFSLSGNRLHPAIKRTLVLLLPLLVGAFLLQFGPLVDRFLASEEVAGIAQLGYSWRVITALMTLTSGSLSIVVFPTLSALHAAKEKEAFTAEIAHGLRFMTVLLVPICVGLGMYSDEVVRDVYQRGEFTTEDTRQVAWLLVLFLGVLFGCGFGSLVGKVFYALHDTRTPMIISLIGAIVLIPLKFFFGGEDMYGVNGIAAVSSAGTLAITSVQIAAIRLRVGQGTFVGLRGALLRSLTASVLAVVGAWFVVRVDIRYSALIAAPIGAITYLLTMWALRDEFAVRMMKYFDC